jgi:hypothetical protein
MKCPLCNIEAGIAGSNYITTEDVPPKTVVELQMKCRNPNCTNHNRIFEKVRNEIPVLKAVTE